MEEHCDNLVSGDLKRTNRKGPWQRVYGRVLRSLAKIPGHDQNGPDGSSLDPGRAAHPQPLWWSKQAETWPDPRISNPEISCPTATIEPFRPL